MRVTIRIDDDLHKAIRELSQRDNISMSQVVNDAIRRTLETRDATRFKQQTHCMGKPLIDLAKANAVAAELEDEEILRKLSLGK